MIVLTTPGGFVSGAKLADKHLEKNLVEAGLIPGYPLTSLTSFDELWALHALSHTKADAPVVGAKKPLIYLGVRLPDGNPNSTRPAPMRVREIRRVWPELSKPYWYLTGHLDDVNKDFWYLNRKKVAAYFMRVVVFISNARGEGYVQFVPQGPGEFEPESDDLRWATCPSKIPPRVKVT
jgi:hypothetical protein